MKIACTVGHSLLKNGQTTSANGVEMNTNGVKSLYLF